MKKLTFLFFLWTYINVNAADLVVDNIAYIVDLNTMEATVAPGDYAFRDIIIPETFEYNGRTFTVTKIGYGAFLHHENTSNPPSYVTKLVIPHTVKTIEEHAFSGTKYLKKLVIPNSIVSVGDFNYFTAKDSIIIEEGETSIVLSGYKNSNFAHFSTDYLYIGRDISISSGYGYYGLVSSSFRVLEYGDKVKRLCTMEYGLGNNNYYTTKNVETIILGESINPMFYGRNLKSLKEIYSKAKNPRGYEDKYGYFTNSQYMNLKLYVPQGCMQTYLETEGWKKFFNISEYDKISGIDNIYIDNDIKNIRIWNLNGWLMPESNGNSNYLPRGLYIINGKKVFFK